MGYVLRYGDPAAMDHPLYGRYATVTAGAPGRCPECEEFGYIDGADLARRRQEQHCRGCGVRWSYAFREDGTIAEVHGLREAVPEVLDLRESRVARRSEPAR